MDTQTYRWGPLVGPTPLPSIWGDPAVAVIGTEILLNQTKRPLNGSSCFCIRGYKN